MNKPASLRVTLRELSRRLDQRPQRERLLLIGAAAAIAFLAVDALLLGPALKSWRTALAQQQAAATATISQQADAARRQAESGSLLRQQQAELDSWRRRVREGDEALQAHEAALVGPEQMVTLLEQMLAQRGQIRLRSMQSLARIDLLPDEPRAATTAVSAAASAAAAPATLLAAAPAKSAASGPTLYRHGVELTVEGSFPELLDYLRALEAMPQRVLFGKLAFKVEQHPRASLTLRLYTVSRERHWLEI